MKINTHLSITRDSRDVVTIRAQDDASHATFLELELTLEQFAMAVTGMHISDVVGEVRNLDVVGKTKITEWRSIECPLDTYDKTELVSWLEEHGKEDGWAISTYIGSQGSVSRREGKIVLRYSVYRYEEKK